MANTILVGAQWGDEGKGKIIDVLTEEADIVVRTQGGNNAGHTVHISGQKYVLHLVPSGILRKKKICVIGNGVVVDPISLVEEIQGLRKLGIKIDGNLFLSETAHVVFPYHRELDAQREILKGKNKIGTTKRGIGPAYGDKAARTGLRVIDLVNPERFKRQLELKIKENNEVLKAFGAKPLSFKRVHDEYRAAGNYLKPLVANTVVLLHEAVRRGDDILFEGAQGTFLDIDYGTYPFVTSSTPAAANARYRLRTLTSPTCCTPGAANSARRLGGRVGAVVLTPSPPATLLWSMASTNSPSRMWTAWIQSKLSKFASLIALAENSTTTFQTI